MTTQEICTTTGPSDVERPRCNQKDDNEKIADDRGAADDIQLRGSGRVEWITSIKHGGRMRMGCLTRRTRTHTLEDGILREGECVRGIEIDIPYKDRIDQDHLVQVHRRDAGTPNA